MILLVILKLYKSNEINDEHPENMDSIFVTFDVSKKDKSNEINEEQLPFDKYFLLVRY